MQQTRSNGWCKSSCKQVTFRMNSTTRSTMPWFLAWALVLCAGCGESRYSYPPLPDGVTPDAFATRARIIEMGFANYNYWPSGYVERLFVDRPIAMKSHASSRRWVGWFDGIRSESDAKQLIRVSPIDQTTTYVLLQVDVRDTRNDKWPRVIAAEDLVTTGPEPDPGVDMDQFIAEHFSNPLSADPGGQKDGGLSGVDTKWHIWLSVKDEWRYASSVSNPKWAAATAARTMARCEGTTIPLPFPAPEVVDDPMKARRKKTASAR